MGLCNVECWLSCSFALYVNLKRLTLENIGTIIETKILPENRCSVYRRGTETVQASHRAFSCSNGLFPTDVVTGQVAREDGANGSGGCGGKRPGTHGEIKRKKVSTTL
ncbi:hypothetical protein QTP88_016806 [Uroleucon formosanum]